MMTQLAAQFTQSVAANISYWQQRTQNLTDDTLPALDQERQNLYRAAKFGLHVPHTWQQTAELILQTFVFVERRGYWAEWLPMLEQLLQSCPADNLAMRGRILDHLGLFYRYNRQLDAAFAAHQEELQIGLMLEDKWREAHACINLGAVCQQMRRFAEAETYILQSQSAFQAIHAPLIKHAFVLLELGLVGKGKGQWAQAEEYLGYSVSLWREVGDPVYLANCLKLLGEALAAQDKTDAAFAAYHEALECLAHTENNPDTIRVLNELGSLHLKQANLTEAERLFLRANASFRCQSGNLFDRAVVANNLGVVYLAQERLAEAEQFFRSSLALWQSCADPVQQANTLGGLAEVKTAQNQLAEAQQLYAQALALLADFPDDAWGQKLQKGFREAACALKEARDA
ncbi:MAG: tetratricopeptide repeat protein [Ardenticatenaceae bacterium]|nr:tetratricopeptide repeat protein [Ardenticatenaceae bacterium]MCB8988592.1 tetratricopeptide repeat protein [Ardenticatenaceae bacterium]